MLLRFLPRSSAQWLAVILIFVAMLRSVAIDGPFVFDDLHSVKMNPSIRSFGNFGAWFTDGQCFSGLPGMLGFRPLVLMTLAFDHWLGGGAEWAFRVGSIAQHLVFVVLVYLCTRRILERVGGFDADTVARAALLGALVFGVHPMHTETINLASSRSEILTSIGALVALQGWLANPQRPARRALWMLLGTAIAVLAKLNGVMVPAVVMLVEAVLPSREEHRGKLAGTLVGRFRSALPLLAAVPVIVVYMAARSEIMASYVGSSGSYETMHDAVGRPYLAHLQACAYFVPKAFQCWLVPFDSAIDHSRYFELGWTALPTLAGIGFVVLSLGYGLWCFFRRPLVTLMVYGSFGLILPWIVVRLNMPLAEHRLYMVAFFWGLPLSAFLGRVLDPRRVARPRVAQFAFAALACVLVARTVVWTSKWRDSRSVWLACLDHVPDSFYAWGNLAVSVYEHGDLLAAVRAGEKAHAIHPSQRALHMVLVEHRLAALGVAARDASFVAATERHISNLSERRPNSFRGPMHYAQFAAVGNVDRDEELSRFGEAWGLSMRDVGGRECLGLTYAAQAARASGRLLEAQALLRRALTCRGAQRPSVSERAEILREVGELHIDRGDFAEARRALRAVKAAYGMGAGLEAPVVELEARLHFAMNNMPAFRRCLEQMTRLGHADVSVFEAKLRAQPAAKPN